VAFCAFLPDLSTDLDAVILRERVVFNKSDWRWAIAEQCGTNTSRQMVVTQFYLHALSGWDVQPFRKAAHDLASNIMKTIPTAGADRDMRLCELGFSMHLLGDTFAHSRLSESTQTKLYETGLGHFFDGEAPDYMLRRNFPEYEIVHNRWTDWVGFAGQLLGAQNGATVVQDAGTGVAITFRLANRQHQATVERAALQRSTTQIGRNAAVTIRRLTSRLQSSLDYISKRRRSGFRNHAASHTAEDSIVPHTTR
jgi:hypothetical protein